MNDFRFNPELISWKEFLLLLEGQLVHLPAPKSHFAKDISVESDVSIFATGKDKIKFIGMYNSVDERETATMDSRWHCVEMSHQIPKEEQKDIEPCCPCFSKLVLLGEVEAQSTIIFFIYSLPSVYRQFTTQFTTMKHCFLLRILQFTIVYRFNL